jgi:hypothetical protein
MIRSLHLRAASAVAVALLISTAAVASAHVVQQVGAYTVALGWQHEPTYVGELNSVEVFVTDSTGAPVADLSPDDLTVTVTFGDQSSDPLPLLPSYDADTGIGTKGDYLAAIVPTAAGDYTFHLTGKIHGQAVDETATSSDSTFASAENPTAIEFPATLPTLSDLVTRLDRLEARIAGASPAPAGSTAP